MMPWLNVSLETAGKLRFPSYESEVEIAQLKVVQEIHFASEISNKRTLCQNCVRMVAVTSTNFWDRADGNV